LLIFTELFLSVVLCIDWGVNMHVFTVLCSLPSGQTLTSSQLPGEHSVCVFMKEEVWLYIVNFYFFYYFVFSCNCSQ